MVGASLIERRPWFVRGGKTMVRIIIQRRATLLAGTAFALGCLTPALTLAQDVRTADTTSTAGTQEAASAPSEQSDVVVTGSRLARDANEMAPSPINTVTAADIRLTGQVDATEALREIPALANSGTIADSIERGEGGEGQATLDLRGLGSNRTLVVVNGRRHVSGVAGSQIVDIATIPNALIERVEVLTGGASAVYGADAVTGVVNFVLRNDFDGLDINVTHGISRYNDGRTFAFDAVAGRNFDDGRGNITLAGSYSTIDEIQQGIDHSPATMQRRLRAPPIPVRCAGSSRATSPPAARRTSRAGTIWTPVGTPTASQSRRPRSSRASFPDAPRRRLSRH